LNGETVKRYSKLIFSLCLVLALVACSDDDDSPVTPPTVGSTNVLNGTATGGAALVVAATGYDDAGTENEALVYEPDMTSDCTLGWTPQGTLCNADGTADDKATSTKESEDSGATWYNYDDDVGATGVLVIDACNDGSCESVAFSEARVFQMYSDGETTHVQLAIHPEMGDTPPAWDDAGWTVINGGFTAIGQGTTADEGLTVGEPKVIGVGSRKSRYVRVEARNDGSLTEADYVELRSLKLF
jgi:hypothetical protein